MNPLITNLHRILPNIFLKGLIFIICFSFHSSLNAAHIVGGEAHYTFLRFNSDTTEVTFRIEFLMYRDTEGNGANFDNPGDGNNGAVFGIWRQDDVGNWIFVDRLQNIDHGQIIRVTQEDDPCVEEDSDVGVEETNYVFDYTFPIVNTSYKVAYQRCCRNNSINNIREPGETGAVFDVEITAESQIQGNSSPQFNNFPPIFICQGLSLTFDHSATDPEGDILRYRFCAPFASGGTADVNTGGNRGCCDCVRPAPEICGPEFENAIFLPPYTPEAPLAGDPIVAIDPVTGQITGTPQTLGQFVVGVCVEEFRDGVLMSSIRRDFQFNVVPCTPTVIAEFAYEIVDQTGSSANECDEFLINSCGEQTIEIINDSRLETSIFEYHWTFFFEDGTELDDIVGGAEVRDVQVTFPDIGAYSGQMILNEGSDCSDTACFVINIYPDIEADFESVYDTCIAGPVAFTDLSRTGAAGGLSEWEWNFMDGNLGFDANPEHQFDSPGDYLVQLTATDVNGCTATRVRNVDWKPIPNLIIVEPSSFIGCNPAEIFFNNLSSPIDSTYDITWDLGDGNFSNEISPTHVYEEPGVYSVSVQIVSPFECETSEDFPSWIRILEGPDADFAFSPDEPNNFNSTVSFTDLSTSADNWIWNFNNEATANVQNPTYTFQDTGIQEVKLTVFHPVTNCPDTITKLIDVRPLVRYFMPNAFTPNNDAQNDVFLGNGFYDGLSDFNFTIWNRWGEQVFQSNDPREGWNGQKNNNGQQSPQGVYVYKVSYTGPRGEREALDGHVTLLR